MGVKDASSRFPDSERELTIMRVANGYIVSPAANPSRQGYDFSHDQNVFEKFDAMIEHIRKRFGEVEPTGKAEN